MNISSNEQPNYTAEIIIALGYLLLFCLFVYTCAGFYYLTSTEEASSVENDFATSLPPITPSPHIPSNYQPGDSSLFKQDFDNNYDSWTDNQSPTGLEFKDGKMFFESQYEDNYALTACGSSQCVYLNQPYYLQADFSADKLTDEGFGVVFNMKRGRDDFFLFLINPASREYYLYHHRGEDWSLRMSSMSDQIQAHPAINTLGIYVNKSLVEFYVNGEIVNTYQDSGVSFQTGQFGVYVDNAGFKLIVDNLTVDKAGG